jgi:NAD(P)-dependent dehydrogenase (short-subunit alcohol dehydrogenase family)
VPAQQSLSAALVTGGGRGIGRAIALRLAAMAPVIVVGRTPHDLESICAEIVQGGGNAETCPGDISDAATAARALVVARQRGWEVAHLVCNAGIGKSGPTETFDPQVWKHIFDVNVHGCFHLVQACLPGMLQRGRGTISILSSLAGVQGVAYDAAYTASKHALVGFTRALAREYSKRGIVVAALCPSFVESDMTRRTIRGVMARHGLSEQQAEQRVAQKTPAKRILPAEEIAEVVARIGAGDLAAAASLAAAGGYPLVHDQ